MTLTIVAILILAAVACTTRSWRWASRTLYAISIILLMAIGCGPVPIWIVAALQSAYNVKPTIDWHARNAIILLGAGTEKIAHTDLVEPQLFSYARIVESASLYDDCRKAMAVCKIFVSGGDVHHTGSPEAIVYKHMLSRLGIDAADIVTETASMNTWQNAAFTSVLLRRDGADLVLLVSSGFHLRRSALYLGHFGVSAIPIRADYLRGIWSPVPLAYNFTVTDYVLHEYLGIARYHIYNALGWNAARRYPGTA